MVYASEKSELNFILVRISIHLCVPSGIEQTLCLRFCRGTSRSIELSMLILIIILIFNIRRIIRNI